VHTERRDEPWRWRVTALRARAGGKHEHEDNQERQDAVHGRMLHVARE
jgi:hypothetical protein